LETYKIIKKTRVGNYLVFYPFIDKNPFAEFNHNIVKSKTTLEIFEIIGDNPGIHPSKIANRMELNHKTVKYHVDKLKDVGLVIVKKDGRKSLLYSDIPKDDILFDDSE
jgi:predicted transcriptional regulator